MKNREYYKEELDKLEGSGIAVNKKTGAPLWCVNENCDNCLFSTGKYLCLQTGKKVGCVNPKDKLRLYNKWLDEEFKDEYYVVYRNLTPMLNTNKEPANDEYFKYHQKRFETKEECQEYIDFWKRVNEFYNPFIYGQKNCYLFIDGYGDVNMSYSTDIICSRYFFGDLLANCNKEEFINYLGKKNIKKFMFGIEE